MIKSIFLYFVTFSSLFLLSFFLHQYYLDVNEFVLPFSLQKVYLFHAGFSLLICVNFRLLANVDKVFPQLGFIYLGCLFFKIILFCVVFYESLFNDTILTKIAKISLILPMFIFLLTEAVFIAKILNKKD
ncbi:hypothetical protein LPB03_09955 [Polaribacter vadi]|uniref:Uncharacterized protein n=1 Tax=Polaribacter vadi TaxID=1774273 RepID=A0A1B8TSB3_9FLAO|nr:DUF6168 family protein [Polaribacter vadi]AOW17758.1 hypothetical protein LPB03_09955 [Polaribacter vadi]OBY62482.1 hypothetical protein LPB3_09965 [Polaribacter vadi]